MTAVPPRPAAPEVGRCGNTSPSFIGAPPDICALPAGHPGWHRGDLPLHGRATEWSDARDATAGDGLREELGRWMFERSETWRDLCSPEDADWDEWVDRNREQWRKEADAILAKLPALRDVLAAAARDAELRKRVEAALAAYDEASILDAYAAHRFAGGIRRALDGPQ